MSGAPQSAAFRAGRKPVRRVVAAVGKSLGTARQGHPGIRRKKRAVTRPASPERDAERPPGPPRLAPGADPLAFEGTLVFAYVAPFARTAYGEPWWVGKRVGSQNSSGPAGKPSHDKGCSGGERVGLLRRRTQRWLGATGRCGRRLRGVSQSSGRVKSAAGFRCRVAHGQRGSPVVDDDWT